VGVKPAQAERRRERADGFRFVGALVALMWVIEVIDSLDHHRLDGDGIVPRQISGLPGILFAPFLHASFGHLLGNTVPFLVLGLTIALGGVARVLAVTVIVTLVSGLGTWLVSPGSSVTIGASGVVFGFATYLLARGVFNRSVGQIAIGAVVGVIFGGALLWSLIPHSGVSWQDHLFGAIGGVLAARLMAADSPRGRRRAGPAAAGSL
jgi:membrane associated rhomboid family serine protease